jgi:hypothetical protein
MTCMWRHHVIVAAQPIAPRDQDEQELRSGDVCGGGRSPFRAEPAAEPFGNKTAGC